MSSCKGNIFYAIRDYGGVRTITLHYETFTANKRTAIQPKASHCLLPFNKKLPAYVNEIS